MHEIDRIIAAANQLIVQGKRGILVTVVATRGSTYRRAGARAVISEEGQTSGTLSGGCLERDLAERARQWLSDFTPRVVSYDSTRSDDVVFGLGLGCRGETHLLIEPFDALRVPRLLTGFAWQGREVVSWTTALPGREPLVESIHPQRSILIVGGGPDCEPVAKLAEQIGWLATVIAPREVHPSNLAVSVDLSQFDAAVVMTHNFLQDLELLGALLPSSIRFVGLLGPKERGRELLSKITGLSERDRTRLHSPIGLDLGAETPEEIALSIMAEVQAVLNERSGAPLRESDQPIHARSADPVACP